MYLSYKVSKKKTILQLNIHMPSLRYIILFPVAYPFILGQQVVLFEGVTAYPFQFGLDTLDEVMYNIYLIFHH